MNILIVEDEAISAKRLDRLLKKFFTDSTKLNIVHKSSIDETLNIFGKTQFNILFLDLNLNGNNGFDVLKQVTSYSFHTIVVSAYPNKATEAFEYGVLDFIVKPLTEKRLAKSLNRFYNTTSQENKTEFLTFIKRGSLEIVKVTEIKYIKAIKHYSEIYLTNGNILFHDKPLSKLANILPTHFIRTHKSYIINLNRIVKVKSFTGSVYKVILDDGLILPVGRTKVKTVKNRLLNI